MADYRIYSYVSPDDGTDGFFWRKGEKWLREHGKEVRLLDIAPNLEAEAMLNLPHNENVARTRSL